MTIFWPKLFLIYGVVKSVRESLEAFLLLSFAPFPSYAFNPGPSFRVVKPFLRGTLSKLYYLYVVLRTEYEYHIYISIPLNFSYAKSILLLNDLYG